MAIKDTKSIIEDYLQTMTPERAKMTEAQMRKDKLLEYELKSSKQIFDMSVDELFGMIVYLDAQRSYVSIASCFRKLWNFYIDNCEIIKNPWNSNEMRGSVATERLLGMSSPRFTTGDLENIIRQIHRTYDYPGCNYDKYLECLLMLFYNGFYSPEEIALLKEDMINFITNEIRLQNRTIHLSDRAMELLKENHNTVEYKSLRTTFDAIAYRGGYFKFAIRPGTEDLFQEKDMSNILAVTHRIIGANIRDKYDVDISWRTVYLLGLYDYVVRRAGEQRARELILSVRDSYDAQELLRYSKEFGSSIENVSVLKAYLRSYL